MLCTAIVCGWTEVRVGTVFVAKLGMVRCSTILTASQESEGLGIHLGERSVWRTAAQGCFVTKLREKLHMHTNMEWMPCDSCQEGNAPSQRGAGSLEPKPTRIHTNHNWLCPFVMMPVCGLCKNHHPVARSSPACLCTVCLWSFFFLHHDTASCVWCLHSRERFVRLQTRQLEAGVKMLGGLASSEGEVQ